MVFQSVIVRITAIAILGVSCLVAVTPNAAAQTVEVKVDPFDGFDNHVHIMSPSLVAFWKKAGVPFSKPDSAYSDPAEIARRLGTSKLKLVSMAYVWGHPEFGEIEDEEQKVRSENDFVLAAARSIGPKARAYCGVNPLKDYATDEVNRCAGKRVEGIKLHFNANQVYLTEPEHVKKLFGVFDQGSKLGLRFLIHFDNSHPKTGRKDVEIFFREILAKTKGTRIQIAHFGTSGGFTAKTREIVDAFLEFDSRKNALSGRHRIKFDISAVALDKDSEGVSKLTDDEFKRLAVYVRKIGLERVVFGTDYPLYGASEYAEVLGSKLGLSAKEIRKISKRN